jgi:long-chain fatty acid transport protein
MKRSAYVWMGVLLGLAWLTAGTALGGGFFLYEQSVKSLGNAFAGAESSAEDASTIFYNAAGITRLPGSQFELGANVIMPSDKFDNHGSTTSPVVGGAPLTGGNGGDAGKTGVVPNFYYSQEIMPWLHAGLGVNAPFGLESDYNRDWVGRYYAVKSELTTINFNPTVAVKLHDMVSVGAGFNAMYFDAKLTNAVDYGTIGALIGAGTAPQSLDGFAKVTGDTWGYGWNAGVLFTPSETLRLGLAYRSSVDIDLTGNAKFSTPAAAAGIAALTGLVDTGAEADITLPATASMGAYWRFHPQWAVLGNVFWTDWSKFNELRVKLDTGTDAVTTNDWNDAFRYALGLSYYPTPAWTFRIGGSYEETPIPNKRLRSPRIPDANRFWTTFGLTWSFSKNFGLDLAYAHLFVNNSKIDHSGLEPEDYTRGALNGDYDATVNIISAQLSWRF